MSDTVIKFNNVSKKYRRNLKSAWQVLGYLLGHENIDDFFALNQINLDIGLGEVVGLIGANGAGKSTLLKLIAGINQPTNGQVVVQGTVGALIEVGAGLNPELTGRENIYLYGAIMGMSRSEIQKKFSQIVEFSELHKFLDTPVKFYSNGMIIRLGFSVAVHTEPDVLLVDEVLSVGDASFQLKSLAKIKELFNDKKKTVIFVSHNLNMIEHLCQKVLYLNNGQIKFFGEPQLAIEQYARDLSQVNKGDQALITGKIIKEIIFENQIENATPIYQTNQPLVLRIKYSTSEPIINPVFSIRIYYHGVYLYGVTNRQQGYNISRIQAEGEVVFTINHLALVANDGYYNTEQELEIDLRILDSSEAYVYDQVKNLRFKVICGPDYLSQNHGIVYLESSWQDSAIDSKL